MGTSRVAGKPRNADEAWWQRVGGYRAIPQIVRQLGADPAGTLRRAGLPPDALDDPERCVPYAALQQLLCEVVRETQCGHFGLLVGRSCRLGDLGVVGELVRNSPTVREALQTLVVYQHLNSHGGLAFLIENGEWVDLGYAAYRPGTVDAGQLNDANLAAAFNIMRELCGVRWVPFEVLLPRSKPEELVHYRNFFKVVPRFNSELCALRFPAYWMDQPVEGADRESFRIAEEKASQLRQPDIVQQVYRALRRLLFDNRHSGDSVAQMLRMHRRTLNRRLKVAGVTFQDVLDQVRYDWARQLLFGSDVALDDVAAALGYSGVSPFMRSFQRWAGTTPARWRRVARSRPSVPCAAAAGFPMSALEQVEA
jgi:AraC-like DNA-binding protein